MERITVRVPATSANIGPGFDSLGLAFAFYNTFAFEPAEKTVITGCPAAYAGEDNLALVAFRAACRRAGREAPAVHIDIGGDVPVSRGLGSSATLLVGGALGANLLLSLGLSREDILAVATEIEGHPDNIAPAVYGGFTASLMQDGKPIAVACPVHPSLRFCAFIPDFKTSTHDARAVLPKSVPFADAVHNISHVAVLLSAMAKGDTDLLSLSLQDRLHQPYRTSLIDGYDTVREAALAAGAHAFFISGSGSTCMAIYTEDGFADRVRSAVEKLPHNWWVLPLSLDETGACSV
ncbi:MAG: homoserine kinase [Clostridia bacterium]|nr:homoserine kinase [Clostridia bacterium]